MSQAKDQNHSPKGARVLHLVLFSHDVYYDSMYALLSPYYASCPNVRSYFYTFSPDISGEFELSGDILYIKGTETYIPGILDKTIKALRYFEPQFQDYDYVVRTNISTLTNPHILSEQLAAFINPKNRNPGKRTG